MLKSILKTSIYIACLAGSGIAWAAGLGGINVTSSLGQPLKAEIEMISVDRADKSSLRAKLASADAYKNAGVDYPYSIPKLKFQIEERENGEPYIKVTTAPAGKRAVRHVDGRIELVFRQAVARIHIPA